MWLDDVLNAYRLEQETRERDAAIRAEIQAHAAPARAAIAQAQQMIAAADAAHAARIYVHNQRAAAATSVARHVRAAEATLNAEAIRQLNRAADARCKQAGKHNTVHLCGRCGGTPAYWSHVAASQRKARRR